MIVNITTYTTASAIMAGGKKGENTKKAAGNAKKAEVAAQKEAALNARQAAAEEQKWSQGSKDTAKREAAAAKAAEAAKKKAERDALLAEEEKSQRAAPKGANAKKAEKKTRGALDLGQLADDGDVPNGKTTRPGALNASNIDDALDALTLTQNSAEGLKIDRHPERRFKAAYKAYEERRLPEISEENPGLRKQQRVELVRKEFEKCPENPFNQAGNLRFDSSKDEIQEVRRKVREGVEGRLGEKS